MRLHVERLGSGPDLVLLHGWALHGGAWAPVAKRLAPRFRVHVVDLPGHGLSRGAAFGFAAEQGNTYFRLGTGDTIYYAQRIPFSAGKNYRLELEVRSRQGDTRLDARVKLVLFEIHKSSFSRSDSVAQR